MTKNWKYHKPKFNYEEVFPDIDWPWAGHKYFAYDLIRNTEPEVVVELGVHWGTSFFSFSQGAKDGKTETRLSAVDTWQGDKHAGFYGEDVFNRVNEIKDKYYKDVNIHLLRMTFDEAVDEFEDGSIDILHIDGLHTYKAVKHDFDNWFKKVKKDGIILFHDTHERKRGFGVYKLWNELQKRYVNIDFYHSHGLGVLIKQSHSKFNLNNYKLSWEDHYSIVSEKNILESKLADYAREIKLPLRYILELESNNNKYLTEVNNLQTIINQITSAKFYKIWRWYCNIRESLLMKRWKR
ncbi:MAG: class I SAM-dependent methyltransferase [Patescibacteria group bacterium]|nr:class I SAM-dependent methyltransferase [Patescibacteria group bacterium]